MQHALVECNSLPAPLRPTYTRLSDPARHCVSGVPPSRAKHAQSALR